MLFSCLNKLLKPKHHQALGRSPFLCCFHDINSCLNVHPLEAVFMFQTVAWTWIITPPMLFHDLNSCLEVHPPLMMFSCFTQLLGHSPLQSILMFYTAAWTLTRTKLFLCFEQLLERSPLRSFFMF